MFKKLILGAVLFISATAFAQTETAAEPAKTTPEQAQQMALAGELVQYGYSTKTALPLIQAVQIYQRLGAQPATDATPKASEDQGTAPAGITKADTPARTEPQLLADATTFADGNKTLLALIQDCKGATRGAVGGPKYVQDAVRANTTDVWTIKFRGGESAYVVVSGDGDTDLDLYIYDENGNFITSDTDYTDQCVVSFTPKWTGDFKIKIKNRGNVYNRYTMATN